jgi:hypothetical protein
LDHWITNVGAALHWATDSRDPFNSCHDYLGFGIDAGIARHFGVPGGDILDPKRDTTGYKGMKNSYERTEYLTKDI